MLSEKSNLDLLNKRISELNIHCDKVIVFDFDELVVPIHLTREITQKVSKPLNKKLLSDLGSCSFKGLLYLNSLLYGYDFKEYETLRDKIATKTKWTDGFENLLSKLMKKYSIIFLSSGFKDICWAKLKQVGFDLRNILAGEIVVVNNKISGSSIVISDELKGYTIRKLKENHRIIAVGHSLGDKSMLDNADVSISVNSNIPDLAKFDVESLKEILTLIDEESLLS